MALNELELLLSKHVTNKDNWLHFDNEGLYQSQTSVAD